MPTLASCTIVGHLYRKPEAIGTGERAMARASFYSVDRVKNAAGEYEKEFTSHTAIMFGKEAEWAIRDGEKGKMIAVTGTFRVKKWEKDGKTGAGTDISASSVRILDAERTDGQPAVRQDAPDRADRPDLAMPQKGNPPIATTPVEDPPF